MHATPLLKYDFWKRTLQSPMIAGQPNGPLPWDEDDGGEPYANELHSDMLRRKAFPRFRIRYFRSERERSTSGR